MAYDQIGIQRARVAVEDVDADEDNFAADLTADVATNFSDFRHEPFDVMRADIVVPDTTVVQRPYQRRNHIIGPSRATAKIPSFWTATLEALDATTSPTKRIQSKIFEAVFGGYDADQGSAVVASPSPTTTTSTVTTGHGTRFAVGQIIAIGTSAAVALPVQITAITSDALSWYPALPAAPATADKVYNSQHTFCNEDSKQTLQVLMETARQRGNIWGGLGGSPTGFTFDWSRGNLAKWSLDLAFAKYLHDDELAVPQGGSAIALSTYVDSAPVYVAEGGCILTPTSGTTRTVVKCASLSANFGGAAARFEVGYHNGVEGLGAPERNTRDPITLEMVVLKPDPWEDYHDAFLAGTLYSVFFWLEGGAGYGRCFSAPTCQIVAAPEPVEAFSMVGQKLSLMAQENSRSAIATTACARSPIAFGHY